jgi:hypothetical protein
MKKLAMRAAAVALAISGCGFTQQVAAQTAPSFGQPLGKEGLDGIVVRYARGTYDLGLRDDNGFLDNVRLHDRTIIFPIGVTLLLGMRVHIVGFNQGTAFTANEIDLPPRHRPVLQEPRWYAEWDATRRPPGFAYRNPPAPPFVNPPAPP